MATRLSVNINDDTARALKELAERNETSVTEVVRRAIGVYKYIEDEVTLKHKVLQLVSDDEVTTLALV
jgi:predicted transcriptional regulator